MALPITPITERVHGTPTTGPVEAPHHPCAQCPFGDCAHAHQIITLVPVREFDEVAPVVGSRTHDHRSHAPLTGATTASSGQSHAMTSSGATAFPTSPSPAMQSPAAQPKAGILRQRSISTGGKTVTGTVPPHRPRYKSETGVSSRASTSSTNYSSRGTGTGKFPAVPPLSSGTGASFIPRLQQQGRGTKTRRALSNASGKSVVASSKSVEPPLPSPPLLSAHMLHMRSGSRPCPTHLLSGRPTSRSNTEPPQLPSRGAASLARNSPPELTTYFPRITRRRPATGDGPSALSGLRSSSPAPVVHPSGGDSQLPLPSSREQGWRLRLPTPRAEVLGDAVRRSPAEERYHRRPQTAPEAVLKETPTILVTSEDTAE
jgi:hypothetical protein